MEEEEARIGGGFYVLYLQYPVKQNDSRVVAPQIDSEFITRQYIWKTAMLLLVVHSIMMATTISD